MNNKIIKLVIALFFILQLNAVTVFASSQGGGDPYASISATTDEIDTGVISLDIGKQNINDSANLIYNWSRGSHEAQRFVAATYGYDFLINNKYVSEQLKLKCKACRALSVNNIPLDIVKPYNTAYIEKSTAANNVYRNGGYQYIELDNYSPLGEYMGSSKRDVYYTHDDILIDQYGIPKVRYNDDYYYNFVTMAQFVLTKHGEYVSKHDNNAKKLMIAGADTLMSLQNADGSFRFQFNYQHYLNAAPFSPGWVSSLSQGQAISAFLRVYHETKDTKYLEAADKSFEFMQKRINDGGTLDTTEYVDSKLGFTDYSSLFYQEYVTNPPSYTLNGFIFTMIGLYDLSQTKDSKYSDTANYYFESCEHSLRKYLRYYDLGNFTAYDLSYITNNNEPVINPDYHICHIELMETMYSITKKPIYNYYQNMWKAYVN